MFIVLHAELAQESGHQRECSVFRSVAESQDSGLGSMTLESECLLRRASGVLSSGASECSSPESGAVSVLSVSVAETTVNITTSGHVERRKIIRKKYVTNPIIMSRV